MAARHIIAKQGGLTREDEATFGTDPDSSASRLHRAENIAFKPAIDMIPVPAQKTGDMLGPEPALVGGYGGELSFDMPLHTHAGNEAPVISLIQSCGGKKVSVAAGAGDVTDGTANTMVFLTIDIGNIAVGTAVMHDSASGTDSVRFVERVQAATPGANDTTITVNTDWATQPASGDGWTAMDSITPSSDLPTYQSFHGFRGSGATDIYEWVMSGCAGLWSLKTTDARALPMIPFVFQVDNWTDSEATLAQANFAGNEAAPLLGDSFLIEGTAVAIKSLGFDPGMELIELGATSGSHGREGRKHVGSLAKLEILPRHDITLVDKWEAGTVFDAFFSSVQSSTDGWALWIPAAQIMSYELNDVDGLLRPTMEIQATDKGMNTDAAQLPQWAFAVTK